MKMKREMCENTVISVQFKHGAFSSFSPFPSHCQQQYFPNLLDRRTSKRTRKKDMHNYRRVAGYTSDTIRYQWKEISNRSAEIIIPWALSSLLIEIMKSCSLCLASVSLNLRTSHTIINNIPSENHSNFTIR